jgi:hypothetical protein
MMRSYIKNIKMTFVQWTVPVLLVAMAKRIVMNA